MLFINLYPLLISPGLYVIHIAAEMAPVAKVCSTMHYGLSFLSLLNLCEKFSEGPEGLFMLI